MKHKASRRPALSASFFDRFLPKKKASENPPAGGNLPALPPPSSQLPGVPKEPERRLSMFDVFSPKPAQPQLPAVREEKPSGALSFFQMFKPTAPAPPPTTPPAAGPKEEQQLALWQQLFPGAEERKPEVMEQPPARAEEIFQFVQPTTEEPRLGPIQEEFLEPAIEELFASRARESGYPRPEDWPLKRPPKWIDTRWMMPTSYEIATLMEKEWDLPWIFEQALLSSESAQWRRAVQDSPHTGEPAKLEIMQLAHWGDPYDDLSKAFHVPEYVIDKYFEDVKNEDDAEEATYEFAQEVMGPMIERYTKAVDVLRPRALRGWFDIEAAEDGSYWLTYNESLYRPL